MSIANKEIIEFLRQYFRNFKSANFEERTKMLDKLDEMKDKVHLFDDDVDVVLQEAAKQAGSKGGYVFTLNHVLQILANAILFPKAEWSVKFQQVFSLVIAYMESIEQRMGESALQDFKVVMSYLPEFKKLLPHPKSGAFALQTTASSSLSASTSSSSSSSGVCELRKPQLLQGTVLNADELRYRHKIDRHVLEIIRCELMGKFQSSDFNGVALGKIIAKGSFSVDTGKIIGASFDSQSLFEIVKQKTSGKITFRDCFFRMESPNDFRGFQTLLSKISFEGQVYLNGISISCAAFLRLLSNNKHRNGNERLRFLNGVPELFELRSMPTEESEFKFFQIYLSKEVGAMTLGFSIVISVGEIIEGNISESDLRKQNSQLTEAFTATTGNPQDLTTKLTPYLVDILEIMSEKGVPRIPFISLPAEGQDIAVIQSITVSPAELRAYRAAGFRIFRGVIFKGDFSDNSIFLGMELYKSSFSIDRTTKTPEILEEVKLDEYTLRSFCEHGIGTYFSCCLTGEVSSESLRGLFFRNLLPGLKVTGAAANSVVDINVDSQSYAVLLMAGVAKSEFIDCHFSGNKHEFVAVAENYAARGGSVGERVGKPPKDAVGCEADKFRAVSPPSPTSSPSSTSSASLAPQPVASMLSTHLLLFQKDGSQTQLDLPSAPISLEMGK